MRPPTRRPASTQARALYPVRRDLRPAREPTSAPRLRGVGHRPRSIGNHGVEPSRSERRAAARCAGAGASAAAPWRRRAPGVRSRTRASPSASTTAASRAEEDVRGRRILRAAAGLGERARRSAGKQVVNVVPAGAPHKGMALERERARLGCDTAALRGRRRDRRGRVRPRPARAGCSRSASGRSRAPRPRYYIRDQGEIDRCFAACWPRGRGPRASAAAGAAR